jgi:hypothetical protein
MLTPMLRWGLVLGIAALVLAALDPSPALNAVAKSIVTSGYDDPAGDSGNAPDITRVTVSEDDAAFLFEIDFTSKNDDALGVFLDTDRNRTTGAPAGIEFALGARRDGVVLYKWDGSNDVEFPHSSLDASLGNGRLTFRIARADISTSSFDFYVDAGRFEAPPELSQDVDIAPDNAPASGNYYTYIGTPTASPPASGVPKPTVRRFRLTRANRTAVVRASLGAATARARIKLVWSDTRALFDVRRVRMVGRSVPLRVTRSRTRTSLTVIVAAGSGSVLGPGALAFDVVGIRLVRPTRVMTTVSVTPPFAKQREGFELQPN